MENFLITVAFLIIGVGLKRIKLFPSETGTVLNLFVIYVSLPAIVLLKIPELKLSAELLIPAVLPWAILGINVVIIIILARIFNWSRPITGCLLLVVPLGNTSFIGIPLVRAFLGEQYIPYAVIYDQLGSFLALATYGSVILSVYGTAGKKINKKDIVLKTITFPPFLALITALLLKPFSYPAIAVNILNMLGATLVPVVMIAVGYQLTLKISKKEISPLAWGLGLKLILSPIAALLICYIFGFSGSAVKVSIFEAGMAPMVSAGALAILTDLAPSLTAAIVGLGIILSFLTLPLLFLIL